MNSSSHPADHTASVAKFDEGAILIGKPAAVACPACQTELRIGEIESCQFAGCPRCRGMLFQQEVFARMLRQRRDNSAVPSVTPATMDRDQLKVRRFCPGCEQVLETHPYGGAGNAVIDTCLGCHLIWLDEGEFTSLVRAPGKR